MMTPVSSTPDPRAAAAPSASGGQEAPAHDLFAALMALLGALPMPQGEAPPPESDAEAEAQAQSSEDAEAEAAAEAEAQAALAAIPAPLPVIAALVLPAQPLVPSDAPLDAEPAARGAAPTADVAVPAAPAQAGSAPDPAALAQRVAALATSPEMPAARPSDAPARAEAPQSVLAAAETPPQSAPSAEPLRVAPAAKDLRASAEAVARLHTRVGAVHATPSANAPSAPVGPPDAGLEPLPVDAAPSAATRPELVAVPPRAPGLAETAPADPPARARMAESVQPVVANTLWLAEQGGGQARLALNPPELGQVEILVRVRGQRVEVHLRVEETAAQQAVRDTRDQLSDALASRELRMDAFSVNGGGGGASGNDFREAARDGGERPQALPRAAGDVRPGFAAPRAAVALPSAPGSAIDLRV